jgi:hypothetical protein
MMRYFYDTEFIEDGRTIDLISIGIVAEDGREYYAVSQELTRRRVERKLRSHGWLMANVVPSLPKPSGDWNNHMPKSWLFDYHSVLVKPRTTIASEVAAFLLAADPPELWADYGAYDHVALCQLWGTMMDLPAGIPMYTNDIQQYAADCWQLVLPEQTGVQHNALEDAQHCQVRWRAVSNWREENLP